MIEIYYLFYGIVTKHEEILLLNFLMAFILCERVQKI